MISNIKRICQKVLCRSVKAQEVLPGVLLVHGFPEGPGGGANSATTLPELAKRISSEMGFVSMAPLLRGTGDSEGCFSLSGWLADVRQAITELKNHPRVDKVWLVGFGSGGAMCICAAAEEPEVKGVGSLAAPADWSAWAASPKRLLIHARRAGVIPDPTFPDDFDSWSAELKNKSISNFLMKNIIFVLTLFAWTSPKSARHFTPVRRTAPR